MDCIACRRQTRDGIETDALRPIPLCGSCWNKINNLIEGNGKRKAEGLEPSAKRLKVQETDGSETVYDLSGFEGNILPLVIFLLNDVKDFKSANIVCYGLNTIIRNICNDKFGLEITTSTKVRLPAVSFGKNKNPIIRFKNKNHFLETTLNIDFNSFSKKLYSMQIRKNALEIGRKWVELELASRGDELIGFYKSALHGLDLTAQRISSLSFRVSAFRYFTEEYAHGFEPNLNNPDFQEERGLIKPSWFLEPENSLFPEEEFAGTPLRRRRYRVFKSSLFPVSQVLGDIMYISLLSPTSANLDEQAVMLGKLLNSLYELGKYDGDDFPLLWMPEELAGFVSKKYTKNYTNQAFLYNSYAPFVINFYSVTARIVSLSNTILASLVTSEHRSSKDVPKEYIVPREWIFKAIATLLIEASKRIKYAPQPSASSMDMLCIAVSSHIFVNTVKDNISKNTLDASLSAALNILVDLVEPIDTLLSDIQNMLGVEKMKNELDSFTDRGRHLELGTTSRSLILTFFQLKNIKTMVGRTMTATNIFEDYTSANIFKNLPLIVYFDPSFMYKTVRLPLPMPLKGLIEKRNPGNHENNPYYYLVYSDLDKLMQERSYNVTSE